MDKMKTNNLNDLGFQPLNESELSSYNGGEIPNAKSSFANDLGYYIAYGACILWEGIQAFGAGAAKGQSLRFSG